MAESARLQTGNPVSDADLVLSFKKGDKNAAFEEIVRRYRERIYWTVLPIVGQHEDADDVAQLCFVSVWKKLDTFREESHLYTWIYRIAINCARGLLRKRKLRELVGIDEMANHLRDSAASDTSVLSAERTENVRAAIAKLPPQQRIVFCLRFYDGLKYQEISRILDRREGTLKANFFHATKKLEVMLAEEYGT